MGRFFAGIQIPWWTEVSVLVFFVFFVGILLYTYSPRRKQDYERFGDLPFEDQKK